MSNQTRDVSPRERAQQVMSVQVPLSDLVALSDLSVSLEDRIADAIAAAEEAVAARYETQLAAERQARERLEQEIRALVDDLK